MGYIFAMNKFGFGGIVLIHLNVFTPGSGKVLQGVTYCTLVGYSVSKKTFRFMLEAHPCIDPKN